MLVETLFSEMKQRRLPAEVHSVYVTAFQIVNESIQDLVQTQHPGAGAHQPHLKGEHTHTDTPRCWLLCLLAAFRVVFMPANRVCQHLEDIMSGRIVRYHIGT